MLINILIAAIVAIAFVLVIVRAVYNYRNGKDASCGCSACAAPTCAAEKTLPCSTQEKRYE